MISLVAARFSPLTQEALLQVPALTERTDWIAAGPPGRTIALQQRWALIMRAGPKAMERLEVEGLSGRIAPRLALPPEVRTADTDRLAYAELAWKWLNSLTLNQVRRKPVRDTLTVVPGHLFDVVRESEDLLLEGGSLPQLIMESLQNQLWGGTHTVSVIRVHINMTTANLVDDHVGEVGSALRTKTLEWLQRQFGVGDVFVDPVGTTFLIKVTDFNEARGILRRFSDEVGRMMLAEILGTATDRDARLLEKLARFRPQHTAFGMTLSVSDLEPNRIPTSAHRRGATNRRIETAMIGRIRRFLRELAAYTSFIERHRPKDDLYNSLYTDRDLPPDETHRDFAALQAHMTTAKGFVATGVYGLPVRDGENPRIVEHPRIRKLTGHLNRDRTLHGGGILQRFAAAVGALLSADGSRQARAFERFHDLVSLDPSNTPLLGGMGLTLNNDLGDIVEVGLAARRYASYPALVKPIEVRNSTQGVLENANFFAEEMATRGYVYVAASENDGAKARREAHPPADHRDRDFQRVREIWFETAKELGMVDDKGEPKVIIAPFQGDQILVGFDPTKTDGAKMDPEHYLKEVQRRVYEEFRHQIFQREHKQIRVVRNRDGLEVEEIDRIPIWIVKGGRKGNGAPITYVASHKRPPHSEMLTGTQTITTTYTRLRSPIRSNSQKEGLMELFGQMGRYIETVLKCSEVAHLRLGRSGKPTPFPLKKGGFGPIPLDLTPLPVRPTTGTWTAIHRWRT